MQYKSTKHALQVLFLTVFIVLLGSRAAHAQQTMTMVLDGELDDYITSMAAPLLKAADLPVETIRVHLIKDDTVNSFVNSQTDIFVMSGLVEKASTPDELRGVLAHEIGHLKGHHLLRIRQTSDRLILPNIIASLIGIGAIAAGASGAGTAVIAGSQAASFTTMLQFSRSQEQQADQIAVNLLNETHESAAGLRDFFSKLRTDEALYSQTPPAYLLTHPPTAERQRFLEESAAAQHGIPPLPTKAQADFLRFKAKLFALTHSAGRTLRQYYSDNTTAGDYARCIAYAVEAKFQESLELLARVRRVWGADDPYLTELEGQIKVEQNKLPEALPLFAAAVKKVPDSYLLRFSYAETLRQLGQNKDAMPQFQRIIQRRPEWPEGYYQLGLVYGNLGEFAKSHVALAEAAFYKNQLDDAKFQLKMAEHYLSPEDTATRQKIDLLRQELETEAN